MQITCKSRASHTQITCKPRVSHAQVTCKSHVRVTRKSRAGHAALGVSGCVSETGVVALEGVPA
eukprot:4138130-Prymnesium_polylepis.1